MNLSLALFALLVLGPVALALFLRVNASVLFMSLCVGEVLVQFLANDAGSLMNLVSRNGGQVSESGIRLALLLIPPILTMIFMFHSVKGAGAAFNILPALGVGLLLTLLVKPLLSVSFQVTLEHSPFWHQFVQAQALVVGVGALLSLFFLWITRRHGFSSHNSSKHHN